MYDTLSHCDAEDVNIDRIRDDISPHYTVVIKHKRRYSVIFFCSSVDFD